MNTISLTTPTAQGSSVFSFLEPTQRRHGDGELILKMAARRLDEMGLFARATALRGGLSESYRASLLLRAEAAYDSARRATPDSSREALLRTTSLYIAHFYAQGL
jgi:hypothetical protein